jgi:hypothetical protein
MLIRVGIWCTVLLSGLLASSGCDSLESPLSDESLLVVESFHEVGQPLGRVRFTRAAAVNSTFDADKAGISGASVTISLLDSGGSSVATYEYRELPDTAGVYVPIDPPIVQTLRTYELEITHPEAPRVIRSRTITPGTFDILRPGLEEVTYQQDPQFEVGVSRSVYPGRQTIFVFSVEGLDASIDSLTPLYREFVDPEDDSNLGLTEEEILEDVLIVASPPINEGNYEVLPDNSINVKLPWLAVAFYGRTKTSVSAIDDNFFDFVRSASVQQGGSTFSPGEIPNVINRIEGATGVFGSYARVSQETLIRRP